MNQQKQKNFILWLTGLSAAGKTTIGKAIYQELKNKNYKIHCLDGDEVRAVSKEKLGYFPEDRDKNIKLAIDLAKKYQDRRFIVIASFISPYRKHREWGRKKLKNYIEVYVNSPLEVCEDRDPKGMYKKARVGEIKYFTGVSDIYEEPNNSDVELETNKNSVNECVNQVIKYLEENGFINSAYLPPILKTV